MGTGSESADIIPVVSEYDKLIEEILELELKLAALAEEIDDLENHVCVELRAEYDQKVGNQDQMESEFYVRRMAMRICRIIGRILRGHLTMLFFL